MTTFSNWKFSVAGDIGPTGPSGVPGSNGVTSASGGTGITVSGATGAVTITNTGVTSAVAGTGVGVSSSTGAVTFSIGQSVATSAKPSFAGITTTAESEFLTVASAGRAIGIKAPAGDASAGILQFTNNAVSSQWASITATNGVLNLNATTVNASNNFTAAGVVTGTGGLVSNVFTTGVSYGSYGAVSLLGAGNNGYTGIANSNYACAVMWNATIFGHYRNNNTWNFYFESGTLNNAGNVVSGGYVAAGGSGITDAGSVSATNWFRSKDSTGWYNQTYGGGIWMQDTTWVRVYGTKNFYCDSQIRSNHFSFESTTVSDSVDTLVRDASNGRIYIKNSSRDLKENISNITNSLDTLEKLSPVSFNWKMSEEDKQDEYKILTKQTYKTMGFVLEDVVDVSPELVTWRKKEEDGSLYPGYWKTDDFIALAIQGIKDLSKKVSDLESELLVLKEQR